MLENTVSRSDGGHLIVYPDYIFQRPLSLTGCVHLGSRDQQQVLCQVSKAIRKDHHSMGTPSQENSNAKVDS